MSNSVIAIAKMFKRRDQESKLAHVVRSTLTIAPGTGDITAIESLSRMNAGMYMAARYGALLGAVPVAAKGLSYLFG